eukprot:scaffold352198_cov14-Prasinocladus_malaysianus.AAC.1
MEIQVQKLVLYSKWTCLPIAVPKCACTGALWASGDALSPSQQEALATKLAPIRRMLGSGEADFLDSNTPYK